MKNTSIFASAAMILATAAIASANPFSDVPASHWAYDAVNSMAEKGIIIINRLNSILKTILRNIMKRYLITDRTIWHTI